MHCLHMWIYLYCRICHTILGCGVVNQKKGQVENAEAQKPKYGSEKKWCEIRVLGSRWTAASITIMMLVTDSECGQLKQWCSPWIFANGSTSYETTLEIPAKSYRSLRMTSLHSPCHTKRPCEYTAPPSLRDSHPLATRISECVRH